MDRLDQLFEQFLRERTYINNVTASTREGMSARGRRSREHARARLNVPIH